MCLEWLNWALFFSVPVPWFSALWGANGEFSFRRNGDWVNKTVRHVCVEMNWVRSLWVGSWEQMLCMGTLSYFGWPEFAESHKTVSVSVSVSGKALV